MDNLKRFVDAQEENGAYETALAEIRSGRKRSHWIWYIFPQIKGLGRSYSSQYYGIDSLYEARQYLEHPVLGRRLRDITLEVLKHYQNGIDYIMGSDIDALKFHSSMTLFDVVSNGGCFNEALETFFYGERDSNTLAIVQAERDYFHSDSAFRRYRLRYDDKGFFESGSEESNEIPREKKLPTLVDLSLRGENMEDMMHHYLYHKDFSPYRLSGVESTISHYCHGLFWNVFAHSDPETIKDLGPDLKVWEDRIDDVESAAETFDWIMGLMKERMSPLLEEFAKESLIEKESRDDEDS